MESIYLLLLAVIQGLTEFLPISSSAHLIIPAQLFNLPDQGLAFDVAVHVGTLAAVVFYLREEVYGICRGALIAATGRALTAESRLALYITISTIPVCIAGLTLDNFIETHLRSILVIAITTIVFGLALGIADKWGRHGRNLEQLDWRGALIIGLAQMVALVPGTSRAGITMTAALALGFDRLQAARYAFLLAIPVIALSGAYKATQLSQQVFAPWSDLAMGAIVAAAVALMTIHFFIALVNRVGMMPFVWYRLALGIFLLAFLYFGST